MDQEKEAKMMEEIELSTIKLLEGFGLTPIKEKDATITFQNRGTKTVIQLCLTHYDVGCVPIPEGYLHQVDGLGKIQWVYRSHVKLEKLLDYLKRQFSFQFEELEELLQRTGTLLWKEPNYATWHIKDTNALTFIQYEVGTNPVQILSVNGKILARTTPKVFPKALERTIVKGLVKTKGV